MMATTVAAVGTQTKLSNPIAYSGFHTIRTAARQASISSLYAFYGFTLSPVCGHQMNLRRAVISIDRWINYQCQLTITR
ncbi:hypothetical protein [Corynebacterium amycolatum]|uniref:hypothetical protein n=1 Tax=Corynebacterium amycolatum TaxID=43765 RepID=UPI002119C8B9|nr:hypothetical protein [Corynebacterium amycolatum]MCQ9128273.1 hypothetical protein [Corynebacterium amycolatum]MCQ9142145.1 hypothetical protein [Corynebacterium amycolatum]